MSLPLPLPFPFSLSSGLGITATDPGRIAGAVTGHSSRSLGWSMPSSGATWEHVLIALLFVLFIVLFALRLWAGLSSGAPDSTASRRTGSHSERGSPTGSTRERSHSRSDPPAGESARHDFSTEMQSSYSSQSIPRDALSESLSDEDRVLRMLAANDGRLRQQVIVERTDWSKSKVSRLLSKMNDKGSIEKISVGRENVITFPSDDPADEPLGETR